MTNKTYEIGDVFIRKSDGRRVKIAAELKAQEMADKVKRYRMSGETVYLDARQLRAQYAEVCRPQSAAPERER